MESEHIKKMQWGVYNMNVLNEEIRSIKNQMAFTKQLIKIINNKERVAELQEELDQLENELEARLEKLL